MRIVLGDGGASTLSFTNNRERDEWGGRLSLKGLKLVHEKDMANVAELSEEAATKAKVLSKNPALGALHASLVAKRKVLTDEEFWATRQQYLSTPIAPMRSAHFTRELLSESSQETSTYKLNSQLIKDIFEEHPLVEEAYVDHVLHKSLPEASFWSDFLKSPYFQSRELRGGKSNIFTGILQREEARKIADKQKPTLQLEPDVITNREGYGTRKPSEWTGSGANMEIVDEHKTSHGEETGKKFNYHSRLVLKNTTELPAIQEEISQAQHDLTPCIVTRVPCKAKSTMMDDLPSAKRVKLPSVETPLTFTRASAPSVSDWLLSQEASGCAESSPALPPPTFREREVTEVLTQYWSTVSSKTEASFEKTARLLKHIRAYHGELEDEIGKLRGQQTPVAEMRKLQKRLGKALAEQGDKPSGWQSIKT
eukprot:TRINITY_DN12032_c0_g1_i1.p1 TRINITY_DN12032_c0_g1~~TRINITY_DN12032_c0_g1_i1.p1  ORF type:complete len:424 (+),score=81.39 TRINITY_DN12032_c0_g1_i1:258-1529(+)